MSGAARFVKKVWKQKFRFQKKYWKVAAIAVACYFTAGLAMGAMPAAGAATGAVGAGAGAAAAGTGVMTTTVAAAGSTAAAAAGTAAAIETVTVTAAAAGGGISAAGAAGAIAGGVAASSAGGGGGAQAAKPVQPAQPAQPAETPKPGLIDKAKTAWKDMSFSDKLLLAKAGVDVVGSMVGPSAAEEAALAAKWQGSFYGQSADEAAKAQTQFVTQQNEQQKPPAIQPGQVGGQRDIAGAGPVTPPSGTQQPGMAGLAKPAPLESTAQQPMATPQAPAQQVTNQGGNRDLFAQRAPGVRYLV